MDAELTHEPAAVTKVPWNKEKMIGSKPPLRIKNVWSIRTKLQVDGRLRDLAMFNRAIDSKLRGCDVVTLRVKDIAPHGAALDRATECYLSQVDLIVPIYGCPTDKQKQITVARSSARRITRKETPMFTPMQYRAKAAEAAESLKHTENPRDISKLQQSKRTFSALADNEDWLKDNYDRMVHPVELPAPYGRPKPSAIPSSDAASEEQILRCLGAAVIMSWSTIPTKLQRELFDTAGSMGDLLSSVELRGQIARFLHKQKRHEGYAADDHNADLTEGPFNA